MKKSKRGSFQSGRSGKFGTSTSLYATGITKSIIDQIQAGSPADLGAPKESVAAPRKIPEYGKLAGYPTISEEELNRMPKLKFLKNVLSTMTYQKALKNLRALKRATNLLPLSTAGETKKTQKMTKKFNKRYAALTPDQREAEKIFFLMGGSLKNTGTGLQVGQGSANKGFYESLGLTAPTTKYAPIEYTQERSNTAIKERISNPLSQTQRSKLQNLRAIAKKGQLTSRQRQELDRLVAKKNAPRIVE
jgi:hypothetical protein